MIYLIAKSTEKGTTKGKILANTKLGKYKGMAKDDFITEVHKNTCESFEIFEIESLHEDRLHLLNLHYN